MTPKNQQFAIGLRPVFQMMLMTGRWSIRSLGRVQQILQSPVGADDEPAMLDAQVQRESFIRVAERGAGQSIART
jgi:hypothetical protein